MASASISFTLRPTTQNEKCVICLKPYVLSTPALAHSDHHSFHSSCLKKWISVSGNKNCPSCKILIDKIEGVAVNHFLPAESTDEEKEHSADHLTHISNRVFQQFLEDQESNRLMRSLTRGLLDDSLRYQDSPFLKRILQTHPITEEERITYLKKALAAEYLEGVSLLLMEWGLPITSETMELSRSRFIKNFITNATSPLEMGKKIMKLLSSEICESLILLDPENAIILEAAFRTKKVTEAYKEQLLATTTRSTQELIKRCGKSSVCLIS